MNYLLPPSLFLPDAALLPLLTLAGLLMIVGLRRLAGTIMVFVLVSAFAPLLEPLIAALLDLVFAAGSSAWEIMPLWMAILLGAGIVLSLMRLLAALFIGRNAADQMVGTLAADVVRFLLLLPFRGFRRLLRWLILGGRR